MGTDNLYKFPAISSRKGIPFFVDKKEIDFKNDPYEQYYTKVLPSIMHHFHPYLEREGTYHSLNDWILKIIAINDSQNILDLGCGVGFHSGSLAQMHSGSKVIGLDYSYQMLKFANDYWKGRKEIVIDWSERGFSPVKLKYLNSLNNLSFILSRAEETPFKDERFEIVISNFLWDRLSSPEQFVKEVARILKPGGLFIMTTPLNYNHSLHWEKLYPVEKVIDLYYDHEFELTEAPVTFKISTPIDIHNNCIRYHVVGLQLKKKFRD